MPVLPGFGQVPQNVGAPGRMVQDPKTGEYRPSGTNTSLQTDFITAAPSGAWMLPVIGMTNTPGKFQAGGPAQWSAGSFGYQKPASKGGHVHKGVDIYADKGTGVVAPVSGVVFSMGDGKISGKFVKIKGDDGNEYYYAHLDSIHSGISRGQRVGQGSYLGGVGNTGNAAGTTPHLHFEIRRGGKSVSPNEFIRSGTVQHTTPMSALPGLNTPEEIQAYIDEQVRAAQVLAQGAEGFDPATWNQQAEQLSEEDMIREQTAKGQNILGATLTAMSSSIGGGQRTPMQKGTTALSARTGVDAAGERAVPQAEDLRPSVEG